MSLLIADRIRLWYRRLRVGASQHRNDALGALHRAWAYVHATQLPGDYYEFGVYRGASLIGSWLSQQYFRKWLARSNDLPFRREGSVAAFLRQHPVFHGFDTFSGMPDNCEGEDSLAAGSFPTTRRLVERRCAIVGLKPPALHLVQGPFAETGGQTGTAAAIVHIDCDLYASTVDALRAVAPCLVQGSVVLFDDYNLFRADNRCGERRALTEFQAGGRIRLEPWFAYGPAAQAFLCHMEEMADCGGIPIRSTFVHN
jgi:hypothetical protein